MPTQSVSFSTPTDYQAEMLAIERRRKLAEMLRQENSGPLDTNQTAGGWVIPTSKYAGLAKMLNQGVAGYRMNQADEQQKALGERARGDRSADMQAMMQALGGQEARPAGLEADAADNVTQMPAQAARAPGRVPAELVAALRTPEMQNTAMQMYMKQQEPQKPVVVGRSLLDPISGKVVGTDATWKAEQEAARTAKEAELQAKLADAKLSREERAEAQKQLVQMQIDGRRDLAGVAASLRQPNQEQILQTAEGPKRIVNGQALAIKDEKGLPVKAAAGRGGQMTATAQKELIETEEQLQGGQAALDLFKQAKAINDKAMGFTGAAGVASAGTLLPDFIRPATVDATQNLDNILQTAALPQLKAIFGGMPTEGERKILLDVQGSSSKSPAVRTEIYKRAEAAISGRIKFASEKAKRLREGTYFSGEGLPSVSGDAYAGPERRTGGDDPLGIRKPPK